MTAHPLALEQDPDAAARRRRNASISRQLQIDAIYHLRHRALPGVWALHQDDAKGMGLCVRPGQTVRRGQVVLVAGVVATQQRRDPVWTFTLGPRRHCWLDAPAMLLNHSCHPSCGIVDGITLADGRPGVAFRALRDLRGGEELTWHYGTTEPRDTGVEQCACGNCSGGRAPGWAEMSDAERFELWCSCGVSSYLMQMRQRWQKMRRARTKRR